MTTPGLSQEDYERRKVFLENLKSLTKAEYIEIVRILQQHSIEFSENANGIFFNVTTLGQTVFDALELFIRFTQSNRANLANRESFMSTLIQCSPDKVTLE
jgi:dsDNA-specific endonuclease/ATPase MutS2